MTFPHEDLLQTLGRRSRVSGVVSLVGFVIVVSAIAASVLEIQRLDAAKVKAKAEIADLETRRAALISDIAAKQDALGRVGLALDQGDVPLARQTLTTQQAQAPVVSDAGVRRVYFQIRSKDQVPVFQRCATLLLAQGYRVPPYEYVPDRGPTLANVRYFRPEDKGEGDKLAAALAGCINGRITDTQVRTNTAIKPLQFEVWLAPIGATGSAK